MGCREKEKVGGWKQWEDQLKVGCWASKALKRETVDENFAEKP